MMNQDLILDLQSHDRQCRLTAMEQAILKIISLPNSEIKLTEIMTAVKTGELVLAIKSAVAAYWNSLDSQLRSWDILFWHDCFNRLFSPRAGSSYPPELIEAFLRELWGLSDSVRVNNFVFAYAWNTHKQIFSQADYFHDYQEYAWEHQFLRLMLDILSEHETEGVDENVRLFLLLYFIRYAPKKEAQKAFEVFVQSGNEYYKKINLVILGSLVRQMDFLPGGMGPKEIATACLMRTLVDIKNYNPETARQVKKLCVDLRLY